MRLIRSRSVHLTLATCALYLATPIAAQTTAHFGPLPIGSAWTTVGEVGGITLKVRTAPGPDAATSATVQWRIENGNATDKWLSGGWVVDGTPITGTLMNGLPAGKTRGTGAIPGSRLAPKSAREETQYPEVVHAARTIIVHIDGISGRSAGASSAR